MERKATNSYIYILAMLPVKLQINLEDFLEFNGICAVDNSETTGRM
jgi:hypothetical protein